MRRLLVVGTVVGVMMTALTGSHATGAMRKDPGKVGLWSKPFAELPLFATRPPKNIKESLRIPPAVSMAMLPDGRIIYWGGLEGIENGKAPVAADGGRALIESRVRILDIRDGRPQWRATRPEDGVGHDLFCADQRLLANGKLVAVGGTIWRPDPVDLTPVTGPDGPVGGTVELFGSNAVQLFDPATGRWSKNRKFMRHYRWYPTMITQRDGDLFITSGVSRLIYNYSGQNVHETETFDPQTGSVKVNKGDSATSLPLFPRLHLLPNGDTFYGGVGQMWGPFGQAVDEALWALHKAYNPKKKSWATYGIGTYGARSGAFSVLLPLRPPYEKARILVGGGTLGSSPGSYVANNFSEIITVAKRSSSSRQTAPMTTPRWYSSGVLLPNGHVVAVSGADRDEVVLPGSESPVRRAEVFNGKRWVALSNAKRVRTYHNTAILLPNGSVLVGGHSPINNSYGPGGDNSTQPVTGTNNLKDPSFEIFKPPYLFRGPRPTITSVQRGVAWGRSFSIGTPQAGEVEKVVLSRLPAVTHVIDADQRSVELKFKASRNTLRAEVPSNPNLTPPGYYYLFILGDNGEGLTPSNARIVKVGNRELQGQAVAPMGR